jgi:NAD(P)-dependent dehydrogenase (short-subunit alcohol dehydrogenase family)
VDVTQAGEVNSLVQAAVERYGAIDGAVNNAGVGGLPARTHEIDELNWDFVLNINLKGVWLCMKAEIPAMRDGRGSIVNVASAAGLNGLPYSAHYTASKHGVVGLTKTAALEYGRRGLRVNAVCPGFVDTPLVAELEEMRPGSLAAKIQFNPMKRLGEPREVATAVCWLLSDEASFVNGHAMSVDGGIVAG